MMVSEDSKEVAASGYDEARSDLFREIFTNHGADSFQLYWNSFRLFIIGQLSKEEFDVIVLSILGHDKGEQ